MKALGIEKKGLVLISGRNAGVEQSAGNVEGVKTLHARYLNIKDIFTHDHLVIPLDALEKINAWLGLRKAIAIEHASIRSPASAR